MRPLVAALALAVLAPGCASAGSERGNMDQQLATLAQRPTIEQITARYEEMQARLRDRLSAEVGPLQWVKRESAGRAGCADFPDLEGESRTLDRWASEGNLPDAQWERAVAIAAEVTGEYGFSAPEAIVDRPGDHEITGSDPYGGGYQLGTARNTVLMVSTGCHLPADKHPAADSPAPASPGAG